MNVELLRKIAAVIQEKPAEFDPYEWCGTACCIAGWAIKLTDTPMPEGSYSKLAAKLLGLTWDEGLELFYFDGIGTSDVTPQAAADLIYKFIDRKSGGRE